MLEEHVAIMIDIAETTPYLYLDELADELENRCAFAYLPGLCHVELKRRGLSLQVMCYKALQRSEYNRMLYWSAILNEMQFPWQLVFIDETGLDSRSSRRRRGWGPVGQGVQVEDYLHRGKHISILALFSYTGFLDFDFVEGGYSGEDFMLAMEYMAVPHLQPYPAMNSIVVMDNCAIHHMYIDALRAMIEAVGARLLFLAPYTASKDSPIEQGFNVFKAAWRRSARVFADAPTGERIRYCMDTCYEDPSVGAPLTFLNCGYR